MTCSEILALCGITSPVECCVSCHDEEADGDIWAGSEIEIMGKTEWVCCAVKAAINESGIAPFKVKELGANLRALEREIECKYGKAALSLIRENTDREMRGTATETPVGILGCHE
jgi:hypothetical protein